MGRFRPLNFEQATFIQRRSELQTAASTAYCHVRWAFDGFDFVLDPALRPLFRGEMGEQGRKLTTLLEVAVANLGRPEVLRQLGQRHDSYEVAAGHDRTVETALLWTLEQTLAEAFTPQVRDAWRAVYNEVAQMMQDAARRTTTEVRDPRRTGRR